MIARLLNKLLSADVIGLALLLMALETLTFGIASSLRNTDTKYFFWVCCAAALLAIGLGRLKLNGIQVSVVMTGVGVLAIWILGARLAVPLLGLGNAILSVTPQIIPALRFHIPMDTTAIGDAWLIVAEASSALTMRVQTWLFSANQNVTVNDPLVRNMAWTLMMWLFAAWIGWFAGRRNAIVSLLPATLLLAAITAYSEYRVYTLWLMVSFLLLLMGVWNYKNHTAQWEITKVDYSDSIRYDLGQAVLFLTIVIGAVMFVMPSISWREIRDFLRERNQSSQNEAADLLGVRQQIVPQQTVNGPKPSLPREHLLSGGFAQSEKVVMIIRTGELPPIPSSVANSEPPRHYWRSITYDTYVSGGWVTSGAVTQNVLANTPLIPGLLRGYQTLHLNVKMIEPEGKLFWSGILFSADIPFKANWRTKPQSDLFADQNSLLQADMFAALSTATSYRAEAYIPNVTLEELRTASTNYPEEIKDRYLELPASLTKRVSQLATDITKGQMNPYDKAKAIETFLRTYPYDLKVPAPPEDRDVADYFLFDLKKGYCDYYATAMVVLARANGLPARFVSGYSSGSYDVERAQYIVRELNAHSWAEVYFPEIGWIEFEPTAAEPEIKIALSKNEIPPEQATDSTNSQLLYRFRMEKLIYLFSPFAALLFAFILYFTFVERWWYLQRLTPNTAIENIYRRLYRLGRPLAGDRTRAETAYEFMQKLVSKIDALRGRSRFPKILLRAQSDIELLTDLYQNTLFSHSNIQKKDVRNALHAWRHLRLRLWWATIIVRSSAALRRNNLKVLNRRLLRTPALADDARDVRSQ